MQHTGSTEKIARKRDRREQRDRKRSAAARTQTIERRTARRLKRQTQEG